MKTRFFAMMALLGATACTTYSLEELRHAKPSDSPFHNALAQYYLAFAASEEREYDWIDSGYFADKGLAAIYGNEVGPEELVNWKIPAEILPQLDAARERLLAQLTSENIKNRPDLLAEGQYYFDCWVEQQEENWQVEDIAHCRSELMQILEELEGAPKKEGSDVEVSSYIVFFQWGQTQLSESGKQVIDEVLKSLESGEVYDFVLNGHTDTVGTSKYNLELSQRRGEAVKKRLVDGGVSAERIKIFAYGESDLQVKTADNVDEPANRRVEIFLNE